MPSVKRPARANAPSHFGRIGNDALAEATGRTWAEWIAVLDAAGAADLPHDAIAELLATRHKVPGWWSQSITVGYEQAKGRRVVGQTCTGDFAASASKTLPLAAVDAHAWFADANKRARWLDDSVTLRSATAPKSARLQFPDGSIAGAWITPKGDAKCSVGINHPGLPDAATAEKHKAFWQTALARLAELTSAR